MIKKSLLDYCYSNLPNFSTHENTFCWLLQPVQIRLRSVEFLIKFVFLYLQIRVEFSKCLRNRRVLLSHATDLLVHTDSPFRLIRPSGRFLFTVIARTSLLVPADVSFLLPWPIQTKPSTRTFSYRSHSPQRLSCPHIQAFTFLCRSLHRPTRPQGHFLFTDIAHTGFLIHSEAF